ncbi:MAG: hypothetical protein J5497_05790, partial [Selenomonadaceae bacterium]|nr:hypothetical protein [Selenomonadaceae bacterium]
MSKENYCDRAGNIVPDAENRSGNGGSGVHVMPDSTFSMEDGNISGNKGEGVFAWGAFDMSGG